MGTNDGACSWNRLATALPLELAPSYQTSLMWGSKTREQKFCCATHFFAKNRWCRWESFAPGACYRSVLRKQPPLCVPAFTLLLEGHCCLSNKIINYSMRRFRSFWCHLKVGHVETFITRSYTLCSEKVEKHSWKININFLLTTLKERSLRKGIRTCKKISRRITSFCKQNLQTRGSLTWPHTPE